VGDELNPDVRTRALDLYDPANSNKRPYTTAYIQEYREAQRRRMNRITHWVKEQLDRIRKTGGAEVERCFITHRTMADPRWLDVMVDPNDRQQNLCVSGNPESVNSGPVGFGRFSTLRSWLSQWSVDDSRADAVVASAAISVPLLAIENTADEAAPASHMRTVFAACGSADKSYKQIPLANHYYRNQPELLAESSRLSREWLIARNMTVT
jgi:hypothetical protein